MWEATVKVGKALKNKNDNNNLKSSRENPKRVKRGSKARRGQRYTSVIKMVRGQK